jgi:hypothetical protein
MSINRTDFESLDEPDLLDLITGQTPEGLRLEYKRETYGGSDSAKKELLKDVSALANAAGGHIVIGFAESKGKAVNVVGLDVENPDAELERLGGTIRTGIEPRVIGCRLKAIQIDGNKQVIVIRVPQSWQVPHRVSFQAQNKYWVRNSSGCHEASMEELRALFGQAATLTDRALQFRKERVAMIKKGVGPNSLAGDGRLIVHIVPYASLISNLVLDPEAIYSSMDRFRPMGSTGGYSPRFNFDGVINERGGKQNHGYTQVFRNGIVEATKGRLRRDLDGKPSGIAGESVEECFFGRLPSYVDGLQELGVEPPVAVMITLEGVHGLVYYVLNLFDYIEEPQKLDRNDLHLPACTIQEYGTAEQYHTALKPAFDALWNAAGFSAAQWFDEKTGAWVGPRRR